MNELSCCITHIFDNYYIIISSIITIIQQFLFFIIAAYFKFDKVTDFAGATNFFVISITTLSFGASFNTRQLLISFGCCLWSIRLTGYLLMRILKIKKDERFDNLNRGFTLQFALFWVIQALWVMIVSSPIILVNSECCINLELNSQDVIGISFWLIGFVIESVSDYQKFNFKNNDNNLNKFCNVGLWSISRHPNYFGEIILWWGIFISSCRIFSPIMYISILSPITITILLLFVSGVNLLENSSDNKYGNLIEYIEYKKSVSVLIPFPQSIYSKLPLIIKKTVFLDFPIYNKLIIQS